MKWSFVLLVAYSSMFPPVALGQGREGNFRNSQDSPMGQALPHWSRFSHPGYAYECPLPPGMRAVGGTTDSREISFVSSDASFVISAWGGLITQSPASLLEEQWRAAARRSGRAINYQRRARSWFVVSGTERDGTEFYEKFLSRGNQVAAFTLKYPRSRLREFEPWVEKIEDGFRIVTNPSRTPVVTPSPAPATNNPASRGAKPALTEGARPATRPTAARSEDPPRNNLPERTTARAAPASTRKVPDADFSGRKTATPKTRPPDPPPLLELDTLPPEKEPVPATKFATKVIPLGSKVIGRPGFVYSPYTSDKSLVDVVDIPSGTKVKCPYTSKVFRVP